MKNGRGGRPRRRRPVAGAAGERPRSSPVRGTSSNCTWAGVPVWCSLVMRTLTWSLSGHRWMITLRSLSKRATSAGTLRSSSSCPSRCRLALVQISAFQSAAILRIPSISHCSVLSKRGVPSMITMSGAKPVASFRKATECSSFSREKISGL